MRRPLRPADLAQLVTLGAPTLSPDGARAVVVRGEFVDDGAAAAGAPDAVRHVAGDAPPPRERRRLWLVDLDRAALRPLTRGEHAAEPAWSPCGAYVAYLAPGDGAGRGAPRQLHVVPVDGGEGWVRTRFPAGVEAFVWDADGAHLLVATRESWRDESSARGVGRWVDRRWHRADGVGWVPTGAVSLWRVSKDADGVEERRVRFDQPPSDLQLSRDGRHLVYLAPGDDREADAGRTRLWSRRTTPRALPRDLLGRAARLSNVSLAPDGTQVAFHAPDDLETIGAPQATWLVGRHGGRRAPRRLTDDLETAPSTLGDVRGGGSTRPRWLDDRTLVVALNVRGRSHLTALALDGRTTALQHGDQSVVAFDARGARTIAVIDLPTRPSVLVAGDGAGAATTLHDANAAFLATRSVAAPERRTCRAADGTELTYWVLTPARPRRDRALVVQVHGGPYANYGESFMVEFQCLAAAGYTVVYGNPRGGSSFGGAFAAAIKGAYGTVDADDVLAITDDALARHDDPDAPVHLTGGSYGGFMTNWLTARTTRYRSAVTQRSICNWLSFFGTSDIGPWFGGEETGGTPWSDTQRLWDQSPLRYVADVRTPTLVIHAEDDHRCPIEQAEQWYTALRELGHVDVRLLRFPDEGHDLSRSGRLDRRIERLEAIIGWFESHP